MNPELYVHKPLEFVSLPIIVPTVVVIGMNIVYLSKTNIEKGLPKSGKTSLSKKIAEELGVVRLTMSRILKKVIQSNTSLAQQVTI